jgi:cellulose synthase/poly-beta-1,6-N-acetylglucosamine synthase-like glycosyltransferase
VLVLSLILGLPIAVLFIQCIAALVLNRSYGSNESIPRPKVAVLIPAHNEASCIAATLSTLMGELTSQDSVIVIADNCTDETAAIARQFDAIVLERIEPTLRGKGYALDYGLQYLKANPPDVVVVVDADCNVHQGAIAQLAKTAVATNRPVQATYLMKPPAKITPKHAVSTLAFMVKNLVRHKGMQQLGLPASLTGTGMAFPWLVISEAAVASGNIVEDKQLGLDLAIAGYPPVFCEAALVTGYFPQQEQAGNTQKTRWVHGHLQTMVTQIPRLVWESLRQRRFDLFAMALDLSVPPVSLLVAIWLLVATIALLSAIVFATSWTPTILLAIEGLLILIAIISTWMQFGRTELPLRMLLMIPVYVLGNIPIYKSFIVQREKDWIRTERDV